MLHDRDSLMPSQIDPAIAALLTSWSASLGRRAPSRADIESILFRHAFYDDLIFEALCNLPEADQAIRNRMRLCTDALMRLIEQA